MVIVKQVHAYVSDNVSNDPWGIHLLTLLNYRLEFFNIKLQSSICPQSSDICLQKAKQKHLGCKKVRGQSEATLLTGICDQKL